MYITKLPFEGKFKVTYPYGVKNSAYAQGYHPGIDTGNSEMPSIYSIVEGIVSYAGWENINNQRQGFGKYVSIKFDVNANGFKKAFLAHMSEIKCFAGKKVNPATIIGVMGSTGNSTGPHTHVEIREYNAAGVLLRILNPATFMGIPNAIGTYDSVNYRTVITQPQPQVHIPKVTLPGSVKEWRIYPLNKTPVSGHEIGKLKPANFGGLTYEILRYSQPNVAVIKTRDFGEVQIYVGKDTSAIIS